MTWQRRSKRIVAVDATWYVLGVLVLSLCMALFGSPPANVTAPKESAEAPPPYVTLSPRGKRAKSRAARRFASGPSIISGLALDRRTVAISAHGVGAALDVDPGDAAALERLAKRVADSAQQQFWAIHVEGDEDIRGKIISVLPQPGIVIVRLDRELPVAPRCDSANPKKDALVVRGLAPRYRPIGETRTTTSVRARAETDELGRLYLRDALPSSFEGAVAFRKDGGCVGLVVGSSTPGAPMVLSTTEIQTALARGGQALFAWQWSVGVGLGTTLNDDVDLATTIHARADLFWRRRWNFALESGWRKYIINRLVSEPTYTSSRIRRDLAEFSAVGSYLLGPPSTSLRVGFALGFGTRVEWRSTRTDTLNVAADCPMGEACAIDVVRTRKLEVGASPMLTVGSDVLALRHGGRRNLRGVRLGYRAGLAFGRRFESLHTIFVSAQF